MEETNSYVSVKLIPDQKSRRTSIHTKTIDPVYNDEFNFNIDPRDDITCHVLIYGLFHVDKFSASYLRGEACLPLFQIDLDSRRRVRIPFVEIKVRGCLVPRRFKYNRDIYYLGVREVMHRCYTRQGKEAIKWTYLGGFGGEMVTSKVAGSNLSENFLNATRTQSSCEKSKSQRSAESRGFSPGTPVFSHREN